MRTSARLSIAPLSERDRELYDRLLSADSLLLRLLHVIPWQRFDTEIRGYYADVATPTTIGLFSQLRRRLIAAIEPIDPAAARQFEADAAAMATRDQLEGSSDAERLAARVKIVRDLRSWIEAFFGATTMAMKTGTIPPAGGCGRPATWPARSSMTSGTPAAAIGHSAWLTPEPSSPLTSTVDSDERSDGQIIKLTPGLNQRG